MHKICKLLEQALQGSTKWGKRLLYYVQCKGSFDTSSYEQKERRQRQKCCCASRLEREAKVFLTSFLHILTSYSPLLVLQAHATMEGAFACTLSFFAARVVYCTPCTILPTDKYEISLRHHKLRRQEGS